MIAPLINSHSNSLIPQGNLVAYSAHSTMFSLVESKAKESLSGHLLCLST